MPIVDIIEDKEVIKMMEDMQVALIKQAPTEALRAVACFHHVHNSSIIVYLGDREELPPKVKDLPLTMVEQCNQAKIRGYRYICFQE